MKGRKIITVSIIIHFILVGIIYNLINKENLNDKKKIIKEMTENEQVTNLNNQINALNDNHTEYMGYIENCKAQIATALTNENVPTLEDATLETMAENIEKVLVARTSDATATTDSIIEGKTAYVNGKKITGTARNASYYNVLSFSKAVNIPLEFDFNVKHICIYSKGVNSVNYNGHYMYMNGTTVLASYGGYLPWDVNVNGKTVIINKVGGGWDDRPVTLYVLACGDN